MAPEETQDDSQMMRRGSSASSINLNQPETPAIDVYDVSPSAPINTNRLSLTQPSFRDNEFQSAALGNGANSLVSGSEGDRSEGVHTFTTDRHFGLGSLERPESRKSNQETSYSVLKEILSNGAGQSLSGVGGAGGGLLLSDHEPKRASVEGTHLAPDRRRSEIDIHSIERQIWNSMDVSAVNKARFLPTDKLDIIVNEPNVRHLLQAVNPPLSHKRLEDALQEILYAGTEEPTGMRRIFAIFILMGTIDYIFDFIQAELYDFNLPLSFTWNKERRMHDVAKFPDGTPLQWFDKWKNRDIFSFETQQMAMLAPVLQQPEDKLKHYELTHQTILPFLEHEHKNSGGYGNVFKVKIHPAHCKFLPRSPYVDSNSYFAVKALHVSKREEFRAEVEILKRFSAINKPHPHLIQLLLTYQHLDNYYLLFPWARSNLKEYWKEQRQRPLTPHTFSWFMRQCLGITAGLRQIHRVRSNPTEAEDPGLLSPPNMNGKNYGRHGDIKPENILCFQKDGDIQLVITDFGLSRYHSNKSKSHSMNVRGFSATYRPPECDSNESSITQRYDMWTLGCLFLEFASWLILGYHETEVVFARARMNDDAPHLINEDKFFYSHGTQSPKVKQSVLDWIVKIRETKDCPRFIDKLLDLIKDHLLVPDSNSRWECGKVQRELRRIQELFTNPSASEKEVSNGYPTLGINGSVPPKTINGDQHESASIPVMPAHLTQRASDSTTGSELNPGPMYSNDTTPYDSQVDSSLVFTGPDQQELPTAEITANKEQLDESSEEGQILLVKSGLELTNWIEEALEASGVPSSSRSPVAAQPPTSEEGPLLVEGYSNIGQPKPEIPSSLENAARSADEGSKDLERHSDLTSTKKDDSAVLGESEKRHRWTRRLREAWLRRKGRIKELKKEFLHMVSPEINTQRK